MNEEVYEKPVQRPPGWLVFVVWCIRHWFLVLIAAALIFGAVQSFLPQESDNPRPGYVDTGETVTNQECADRGGTVVGDVCYGP
jgi:hypothetical protein